MVSQENPDEKIAVIFSTCPPGEAERLAELLVETGRAACVNIVPSVRSVYRWQGKIETDEESLLVIKCPLRKVGALTATLVEAHPYDVPEVISLPVDEGNPAYLRWVSEVTEES